MRLWQLTHSVVLIGILLPIPALSVLQSSESARAQTNSNQKAEADRLMKQGLQQYLTSQDIAAVRSWEQALILYRRLRNRMEEAVVLSNLGAAYRSLSQYNKAINYYQQALFIFQQSNDRRGEANALTNLVLPTYLFLQQQRSPTTNKHCLSFSRARTATVKPLC